MIFFSRYSSWTSQSVINTILQFKPSFLSTLQVVLLLTPSPHSLFQLVTLQQVVQPSQQLSSPEHLTTAAVIFYWTRNSILFSAIIWSINVNRLTSVFSLGVLSVLFVFSWIFNASVKSKKNILCIVLKAMDIYMLALYRHLV